MPKNVMHVKEYNNEWRMNSRDQWRRYELNYQVRHTIEPQWALHKLKVSIPDTTTRY